MKPTRLLRKGAKSAAPGPRLLQHIRLLRRRARHTPLAGIDLRHASLVETVIGRDVMLIFALPKPGLDVGDILRRQLFSGGH